ncbi:MAG TPA: haloacid dehalogenase type II [Acidimicrobiia bacterium]|nr:haloacid dehalogenase type II [Acidimicrobiia bacterium]
MRPELVVFDVNETLLDLSPLRIDFEDVFGTAEPLGEWFARLLHGSLVSNHLGDYRAFGVIGVEALLQVAERHGVDLDEATATEVVTRLAILPVHLDVIPALERLLDAGFRTAALTNSSTKAANVQIENAGLHTFIQRVVSVEEVGRFKPDPSTYRHAAQVMDVQIASSMLVSAHDWDVAGALQAGAGAAFIRRPRLMWSLPRPMPDVTGTDLTGIADQLIAG